jgi:hypothetical protein
LRALTEKQIPHRIVEAYSPEDKDLTGWIEAAFPWLFTQIDWTRVSSHNCVEYTSLEDLVPAFQEMTNPLDSNILVIVMWGEGCTPLLEMQLDDVVKIARQIFEEHETATDVFVFSRRAGWLMEMHHEGTLCFGRVNVPE